MLELQRESFQTFVVNRQHSNMEKNILTVTQK